jgi:hypothetical protein
MQLIINNTPSAITSKDHAGRQTIIKGYKLSEKAIFERKETNIYMLDLSAKKKKKVESSNK